MSKIAAKGAATGTGTFTLAAPATNTDRTVTLPDAAGTMHTSGSANDHASMPTVNGDPVVESGSNSDGYWVRWADGTAIVGSQAISLSYHNTSTLKGVWTYPVFLVGDVTVNANYLSMSATNPEHFGAQATPGSDEFGGLGIGRGMGECHISANRVKNLNSFVSGDVVKIDARAFGRWK